MASLFLAACSQGPSNPQAAPEPAAVGTIAPITGDTAANQSNVTIGQGQDTTIIPVSTTPTQETAETLVAVHFSQRNKKAGYPLFKGLTIRIDSISGAGDSAWVAAMVQGRQRLNPKDSSTRPFREQIRLKAYRKGQSWEEKPNP